jgi:hypothetical protein
LRVCGLASRWPHRGPFLVLAPTNDALTGFNRLPGDGLTAVQARKVIEAHTAVLPAAARIEDGQMVKTLSGRTLQLANTGDAVRSGDNVVLPVKSCFAELPETREEEAERQQNRMRV